MQESYKGIEEGRTNEENFVCDQHPWPGGSGNSAAWMRRNMKFHFTYFWGRVK